MYVTYLYNNFQIVNCHNIEDLSIHECSGFIEF